MKQILYPGTFDPPTLGHLDIIARASKIFDHVTVGIGSSINKGKPAFSPQERVDMLKNLTKDFSNIEVISFSGLLVDFALDQGINVVLRSIRTTTDFDYETLQGQMNRQIGGVETLYLVVAEEYRLISSSLVKEIATHGKRLARFIPISIEETVFNRLSQT